MTAITDAVDELCRIGSGDVLVFLPGGAKFAMPQAWRKHDRQVGYFYFTLVGTGQKRVFKVSNSGIVIRDAIWLKPFQFC
jgi:ATP-dependent helicase HrpA